MKILLLEDELMLQHTMSDFLEEKGHQIHAYADGLSAKEAILAEGFDLLILDINVPRMNGFELLETIREHRIFTPVIFVSALIDIEEVTRGFMLGCADYLKKPFHLKELELRLDNIVRTQHLASENHVILGLGYTYDKERKTLFFQGEPQDLTKRQIQIIDLLASHAGIVVNFDMFRNYVWEHDGIDNASIRAEINRFKKVLKEDIVKNIRGMGYKIERHCS